MRLTALILLCLVVVACATHGAYVSAEDLPPTPAGAGQLLRVGDRIQLSVFGQDAMSGEFEIRPSGEVVLPSVGRVRAADLSPDQLAAQLTTRLRGMLADPRVTIVIASRRPLGVSVVGEVTTPGRYEMHDGDGVLEALARAGGLTAYADREDIYVIRRAPQPQRIRFRYEDLAGARAASLRFELKDGDLLVIE